MVKKEDEETNPEVGNWECDCDWGWNHWQEKKCRGCGRPRTEGEKRAMAVEQ